MTSVEVLLEGYIKPLSKTTEQACCTTTLIRDGSLSIIVDPGNWSKEILEKALKKHDLSFSDINYVILSHKHLDHAMTCALFSHAKIIDNWGISFKDEIEYKENISLTENIKIVSTPGHSEDGISVLVTTEKGTIAIVGDTFMESNLTHKDPYATDEQKLAESREKIIKIADHIIPGHGSSFSVK